MKYSNEGRQALRKAVVSHPLWAQVETMIGRKVSSLSIQHLEMVAAHFGIDCVPFSSGVFAGFTLPPLPVPEIAVSVPPVPVPEIVASVPPVPVPEIAVSIPPVPVPEIATDEPLSVADFAPVASTRKAIKDVFTGLRSKDLVTVYNSSKAPRIDPLYHWVSDTLRTVLAVSEGDWPTIWLSGAAGTGKTTMAKQLAARLGRPFHRINHTANTEAPMLLGMTVPHDGRVAWQDGPLTLALRDPEAVILLDEPSLASPGVMGIYHSLIEPNGSVTLENGDIVELSPNQIIIAADNSTGHGDDTGLYQGIQQMNRAFLDRFSVMVEVPWLDEKIETDVISKRTGLNAAACSFLVQFASMTREKSDRAELSAPVGTRRLVAMAKLLKCGFSIADSLKQTVYPYAPPEDRESLRQVAKVSFPDWSTMAEIITTGVTPPQPEAQS